LTLKQIHKLKFLSNKETLIPKLSKATLNCRLLLSEVKFKMGLAQ